MMLDFKEWNDLVAIISKNINLKLVGLVDNSVELSLDDLKKIEKEESIHMHSCIQGWTGIAEWAVFLSVKL